MMWRVVMSALEETIVGDWVSSIQFPIFYVDANSSDSAIAIAKAMTDLPTQGAVVLVDPVTLYPHNETYVTWRTE